MISSGKGKSFLAPWNSKKYFMKYTYFTDKPFKRDSNKKLVLLSQRNYFFFTFRNTLEMILTASPTFCIQSKPNSAIIIWGNSFHSNQGLYMPAWYMFISYSHNNRWWEEGGIWNWTNDSSILTETKNYLKSVFSKIRVRTWV